MNFRHILVTSAIDTLSTSSKSLNPEIKGILEELATGQYNPDTLPPQKFNTLNMASAAVNDRRIINQINKNRRLG